MLFLSPGVSSNREVAMPGRAPGGRPGLSRGEAAVGAAGRCPPPPVLKLPAAEARSVRPRRGGAPRLSAQPPAEHRDRPAGGSAKRGRVPLAGRQRLGGVSAPAPAGSRAAALSPQAPSGVFTLRPLLLSEGGSSCAAPVGKTSFCSLKHVEF